MTNQRKEVVEMNRKRSGKKHSIESLSEMLDNFCSECLKSPLCEEIRFNCLRNAEKQMKEIFVFAKSTQEQQIKDSLMITD